MDLIQSSFQSTFNARIDNLAEQEAAELRTIFRYFDTRGDGAVSADQACRIFGLLGLDVNREKVGDLEEVYLTEFMKIVDAHIRPPTSTTDPNGKDTNKVSGSTAIEQPEKKKMTDKEIVGQENRQLWGEEWNAIDTYHRGQVTCDDLRFFLRSCSSPFPAHDLDRFFELYADQNLPDDSMILTKVSYFRFRQEYTARGLLGHSDHEVASDNEEDDENDQVVIEHTTRGGTRDNVEGEEDAVGISAESPLHRQQPRADDPVSHVAGDISSDEIIVDPRVISTSDDEFGSDNDREGDDDGDEGAEDDTING